MIPQSLQISTGSHAIVEPNIHDGLLLAIAIRPNRCLDLCVSTTSGANFRFVLEQIFHVRANDFREGNIILDATVVTGDDVRPSHIDSGRFFEQGTPLEEMYVANLLRDISAQKLLVFELNPSYGCHLCCVAKVIRIASPVPDEAAT